jgi:hypothetical protein
MYEHLNGLLQANRMGYPDIMIDEAEREGSLSRLVKSQADLDDHYHYRREMIDAQLKTVRGMLSDGDFEVEPEFSVDLANTETPKHPFSHG